MRSITCAPPVGASSASAISCPSTFLCTAASIRVFTSSV